MNYKLFGTKTGLYVSELVLGGGLFGSSVGEYGATPDEARSLLRTYHEAGGNFIDTSDAYKLGESEKLIGAFVKPNRHDFVISSKYTRTSRSAPSPSAVGNHRKAMVQAVDDSLKRLQTDYIDIYMAHFDDGQTPIDEITRGLDDLGRAGKIVYGGLSNSPAWRVALAANTASLRNQIPIVSLQIEYNLLQRTAERDLLPMASALGMGVMMYSPLAGGLLTGKYQRGEAGRMSGAAAQPALQDAPTNEAIQQLITLADELNATPGQVALAWLGAKGGFPVVGPRRPEQLADNLGATRVQLSAEQVSRLDALVTVSLGYPHELLSTQRAAMKRDIN